MDYLVVKFRHLLAGYFFATLESRIFIVMQGNSI
jgi:hypothetical protein